MTLTIDDQTKQQEAHQATLCEVHVVGVAQPLLRLAADLTLLTSLPLLWCKMSRKVVDEVLSHHARLGKDNRLGDVCRLDGNLRRLAKRMVLLEIIWREEVLATLVDLDIVVDFVLAFSQEPDDTLGSGLVEPEVFVRSCSRYPIVPQQ